MGSYTNTNFINDKEKMRDFKKLSKKEFLASYSYLTEQEYDNTAEEMLDKLYGDLGDMEIDLELEHEQSVAYWLKGEYEKTKKLIRKIELEMKGGVE